MSIFLQKLAANARDLLILFRQFPAAPRAKRGGKRILIFNWRDIRHSLAGGAEIHIHEMAKRWAKAGHSVTLFCANDGKSKPYDRIDGVRIIRRGSFMGLYLLAPLYYFVHFRGKIDVIMDCENGIPFFSPVFAKEPVCCFMFHVHEKVFKKLLKPIPRFIAEFIERYAMPLAYRHARFITISRSTEREMRYWGISKGPISVIPPGVDSHSLKPGKQASYPLVSYVGRLKRYKSVDVLIRAFVSVVKKHPSAKLVIVGSGDDQERLQGITNRLSLQESVVFTGKISEREKLRWLQQSWVSVQPSLMEGWGLTVIEANACGVPVIAADVPGLRDSVSDGYSGYLVPHGNVRKWAEKMLYVLRDASLRRRIGKNALEWSAQFDWADSSRDVLRVLVEEATTHASKKRGHGSWIHAVGLD